jgi:GNAT superfamily N-acetyltransferase
MQVTDPSGGGPPVRLADGRVVWLRRLRPDDAPRLVDLRTRLSPETVRRRFLRERPNCDPREAEALANVDQVSRVAFAAVPTLGANAPLIAVGRYHVDDGKRADLALVVEDAYQHVGLGRVLLARLLAEARRQDLKSFEGHVLIDNRPVLQLLRSTQRPLEVRYAGGGDVLQIQLDIAAAARRASVTGPAA